MSSIYKVGDLVTLKIDEDELQNFAVDFIDNYANWVYKIQECYKSDAHTHEYVMICLEPKKGFPDSPKPLAGSSNFYESEIVGLYTKIIELV